jgi:hypothetical protein
MRTFVITAAALTLAACAGGQGIDYARDLAKIEADCAAKGGTVAPSGKLTGEAALDNLCRLPPSAPNRTGG